MAGTVVDEAGRGIAGARVRMLPTHFMLSGPGVALEVPESWLTTETDANGGFCFSNVPADASADFLVTAPGWAYGSTFMASDNSPGYRYAAGQTDIRIVLPAEAKIQGRVLDPAGNPVAGIRLLLRADKTRAKYHCTNRTVSGQDGRFLFENVPADTYSLQVVAPRGTMAQWVGKDVKVFAKAGRTTDGITVRVSKGGMLDVVFRDAATNRAINNARVSVIQGAGFGRCPCFYQIAKTGSNGFAHVRAPLGECIFVVWSEGYSSIVGKHVVKKRPSRLGIKLNPSPKVSGTVRDESGRAVPGATVAVVPPGFYVDCTDEDGRFEFTYRKESERRYLFGRHPRRNLAAAVEIKDRTGPMNTVLKPALTLAGRITDPNGIPIPAARIQLAARLSGWFAYVGAEVFTGTDGRYEIPAVPPQRKDIYYVNVIAAGYCPLHLEEISLSAASANRADLGSFVLQPLNMSISGVVVDADGKPVPNKAVHLDGPPGGQEQPGKCTITNANGLFFFNRISEGPLRLQAGWARDKDVGFLDAQAGDKDVKIVLGQERVHTDRFSLVGKLLPELEQFGLKSALSAGGKKMLVCFWNMKQRPSQNCALQLDKRAKLLADKDVYTVLVYAGPVIESAVNDWLRKNRVTIPVGKFDGNMQVLGRSWAVQSLPWLTITDHNHIVTAEGFSLNELNEKIKEADNVKQ